MNHLPNTLTILPLKDLVLFPGNERTITIKSEWRRTALNSISRNTYLGCVPYSLKKDSAEDDEKPAIKKGTVLQELRKRTVGCLARVVRASRSFTDPSVYLVTLEGLCRFKILKLEEPNGQLRAKVSYIEEKDLDETEEDAELLQLHREFQVACDDFLKFAKALNVSPSVLTTLKNYLATAPLETTVDAFSAWMQLPFSDRVKILECLSLKERIRLLTESMNKLIESWKVANKIESNVREKISKKQRELLLREQLDAIKEELGEKDGKEEDEMAEFEKRIKAAPLSEEARKVADRELKRLQKIPTYSPEQQVIRSYLEWILEIPWTNSSKDNLDLSKARAQLESDHHGLEKIKKRVVEFLAVRKLKNDLKGPILCFLGPPGVGKTSLGRSIATAMGRKFHRISLGGLRDEAEIRGHRRTYVAALPGLFVQALKKCGVNNPVILLDEIDKLGKDFRGDPASALLEVLDPEQNCNFTDHYMGIPLDLSKVLFIATANEISTIPAPLQDRMEIIDIHGYTYDEKVHIAKDYLIPKQVKTHGLLDDNVSLSDENIFLIACGYTREAGVRNLERKLAAICRFKAVQYADAKERGSLKSYNPSVNKHIIEEVLGPIRFEQESDLASTVPGVAIGLAWTPLGDGDVLFIEATRVPGKGELHLTGRLGDVIKESAEISLTWVKSHSLELSLASQNNEPFLTDKNIHIHFPAGAVEKDGPSAGITITTALVSLFKNMTIIPLTAMTGEMTLRGDVLPVGGIKEKVLAAHRVGIKRIIMPRKNAKDLQDIPISVKNSLEIILVSKFPEVLNAAFDSPIFTPKNYPAINSRL